MTKKAVLISRPETPPVSETVRVGLLEIKHRTRLRAVEEWRKRNGMVDFCDSHDDYHGNPGAVRIRLDGTKSR